MSTPREMKTIVSVCSQIVQSRNAIVPEQVAPGQVEVALDDAVEPDQLVAQDAPAREGQVWSVNPRSGTGKAGTCAPCSLRRALRLMRTLSLYHLSVCSSSSVRPVAAKERLSSVSTPA